MLQCCISMLQRYLSSWLLVSFFFSLSFLMIPLTSSFPSPCCVPYYSSSSSHSHWSAVTSFSTLKVSPLPLNSHSLTRSQMNSTNRSNLLTLTHSLMRSCHCYRNHPQSHYGDCDGSRADVCAYDSCPSCLCTGRQECK